MSTGRPRVGVPLVTIWLVWGSTFLGTSIMVQTFPPLLGAGSRYLIAGVLLILGLVVARRSTLRITRRQLRSAITMGLGIIGIWGACTALSQRVLPSGIAAIIAASIPLWVIVFRAFTKDHPTRLTLVGVIAGLVGLVLVVLPGGIAPVHETSIGAVALWSLAMLVASISWAYFSWRSQGYDVAAHSLTTTSIELVAAGVAIMIAGALTDESIDPSRLSTSSIIAWVGLIAASIVGYGAFTYLLSTAPISLVSTYAYVNPIVAVILGSIVLQEAITRSIIIGVVVVVGAVALCVTGEQRTRRSPDVVGDAAA